MTIKFNVDCKLVFDEKNIKEAREKLKNIAFLLKNIHQTDIVLDPKREVLFDKSDLQ